MEQQLQHRYLSGKAAREILDVSDNTLRRWANTGKINFFRNSEKGKRFYDIYSIINENKINNQRMSLANNTIKLSKTDSDIDLFNKDSITKPIVKSLSKTNMNKFIEDNPINKIKISKDDTEINYNLIDFSNYHKKKDIDENKVYCYCKVNKNTQKELLDEQIKKLKQLYSNSKIISCISTNDLNWKKNNILNLINGMKENKIKELIINKSDFMSDNLIDLITELCLIYNIKVIKI